MSGRPLRFNGKHGGQPICFVSCSLKARLPWVTIIFGAREVPVPSEVMQRVPVTRSALTWRRKTVQTGCATAPGREAMAAAWMRRWHQGEKVQPLSRYDHPGSVCTAGSLTLDHLPGHSYDAARIDPRARETLPSRIWTEAISAGRRRLGV
jgi:hypothetical protein